MNLSFQCDGCINGGCNTIKYYNDYTLFSTVLEIIDFLIPILMAILVVLIALKSAEFLLNNYKK